MPAAFRTLLNPTNSGDPYFSAVSLLLHFDGANGSTTFTDSSSNALAVTASGNAQISTSSPKFGSGAGTFDGTGDYLTWTGNAGFNFGVGDFTIEMFFKMPTGMSLGIAGRVLLSNENASWATGAFTLYGVNNTTGRPTFWVNDYSSASPLLTCSSGDYRDSTWHHLAIVRSGSSCVMYIDGTSVATATFSGQVGSSSRNLVLATNLVSGRDLQVDVDELRISKYARYTANFTPPTAAFPDFESTPPADPYFSSTSLLLHMDGTNGSTSFVDSGPNALAVTAVGGAAISTTQSKFGGASGNFSGGGYLSSTSAAVNFGTNDFTVEYWFYVTSFIANYQHIVGDVSASNTMGFGIINNSLSYYIYATTLTVGYRASTSLSLNQWYHFAAVRSGSTLRLYLNGNLDGTFTDSTNISSSSFTVARLSGSQYFTGYIDDLRITKGVARTITVPTKAYPDLYNPYTTLPVAGAALWLDASQQSSLFTDAGATNVKVDGDAVYQWNDLSGNSRTATQTTSANRPTWLPPAKGQNGFSATSYDGTNDFFSVSNTENWGLVFSGDFTIDLWAKFTDNTAQQDLLGQDTGGGQQPKWILGLNNPGVAGAGVLGFLYNLNASQNYTFGVSWTPANNTLYRITVTRSGDDTKFYINGTQQGATVTSANRPRASTGIKLCVGTDGEGYRFTKGQFNEVLFFPFAYSASNMTAMSAYSLAKWGVS